MSALSDRLYAQARIIPARPDNAAKTVRKLDDGGLEVTLGSGKAFTLSADDIELQAFIVYTMLNSDAVAST